MAMDLTDWAPLAAALILLVIVLSATFRTAPAQISKSAWIVPAIISAGFFAWSLMAVVTEGPFGFWPEHTRNLWGNQIWFDLLIAVGIGWVLIVPAAKGVGMKLPLWLILVLSTGCIGVSAMFARLRYLQARVTPS